MSNAEVNSLQCSAFLFSSPIQKLLLYSRRRFIAGSFSANLGLLHAAFSLSASAPIIPFTGWYFKIADIKK
ncbi:hypothetical protein A4R26_24420 [Niastella populi]|uniref:Uncharacterized protein n=1 Tax=Niastella populi TaxID=550983 RepID=A0A1V9FGM1_9BACT|nr:hypothetical protein A4R26_24420 [Niastella populi]